VWLGRSFRGISLADGELEISTALAAVTAYHETAEQTPASILVMMELIGDLLPAGVVNIVNGFGAEAGQALQPVPALQKSLSRVQRLSVRTF